MIPEFTIEFQNDIPVLKLAKGADLSQIYRW